MRSLSWHALVNGGVLSAIVLGWTTAAVAQRRPIADDTLGVESSRVVPLDPQAQSDRIEGGAQRGDNLFHSFREFHVGEGRSVYFADPDVDNILARVTGGVESQILGVLGVLGDANLFLVNPSGIIFGDNARLDVRGSFLATTADAIGFGTQGLFSAIDPTTPPLLTVQPTAFLFNQLQPSPIANNSTAPAANNPFGIPEFGLRVPAGERLTLLGGNVSMDGGGLTALSGRIAIGGLSKPGTVRLNTDGSLSFPIGVARSNVSLTNGAGINAIDVTTSGGSISVNANQFDIADSFLLAGVDANARFENVRTGDITLNAGDLRASGSVIANVVGGSSGNGGDVRITTDSLSLTDNTVVQATLSGQGAGGNVIIYAGDRTTFDNSSVSSTIDPGAVGEGGNIEITTSSLSLANGAQLATSTFGQGDAGNVIINARDRVSLDGSGFVDFPSGIFSTVGGSEADATAEGNGGNIRITTGSLSLTNGARLDVRTFAQGNVGDVILNVRDRTAFNNSAILSTVNPGAVGEGGNIEITTSSLSLANQTLLTTSTSGRGDAGSVIIHAGDRATLNNSFIQSLVDSREVSTIVEGDGGNIEITTSSLTLLNGAQLASSTLGRGDAGDVIINARDRVRLDASSILSNVDSRDTNAAVIGEGGDITITTTSLSLTNGTQLLANTFGQGNAGNVSITASDRISIAGSRFNSFPSGIFTTTGEGAEGRGGNVSMAADSIHIADGASISTETRNRFQGGSVTLNANTFEATAGGQVITSTRGSGQAGNITLNAGDRITLSGVGDFNIRVNQGTASGLFANTNRGSAGRGGTVQLTTGQLQVFDRARIAVDSQGSGVAGNIDMTAASVQLEGQARLTAETAAVDGGNIILRDVGVLQLSNNSLISTTAGTAQAGGNGGNININADFIIALPNDNSDIRANAFRGNGGNVNITTEGLFGIATQPQDNPFTSDITASSQQGVQGTVNVTTPDVDPRRGLAELPVEVVDAANQITQSCSDTTEEGTSEFVVTGRGGVPTSPIDPLVGDDSLSEWSTLDEPAEAVALQFPEGAIAPPSQEADEPQFRAIVEAQGWVVAEDGTVRLIAAAPTGVAQSPEGCRQPEYE